MRICRRPFEKSFKERNMKMKKLIALVLAAIISLGFAACGKDPLPQNESKGSAEPEASSNEAPSSSYEQKEPYFDEMGFANESAYEIVYNESEVISYFGNVGQIHIFVAVKNVSDKPFSIDGFNHYDLYRKDGDGDILITEDGYFKYSERKVVYPGETGYIYAYDSDLDHGTTPLDSVYCVPRLSDITEYIEEESHIVFHNAAMEDVSNIPDDTSRIRLNGTVTVSSDVDGVSKEIYITAVGFNAAGKPVCMFTGSADGAAAGETVEFTLTSEVYGSITAEDVASVSEVCAYSFT